jgi:predicted alpha/beta superfamily hydrolase
VLRHVFLLAMAFLFQASPVRALDRAGIVTSSFDIKSDSGIDYRIFTAVPDGKAPAGGFPIVYLIDGNMTFPIAEKVLADHPEMKAVLAGIGYPFDDREEIVKRRYFDLTSPRSGEGHLPAEAMGARRTGGQEAFLSFIQNRLKPEIETRFAVDRAGQTLFGHSLGGLLVLHVLFTVPDAFQTYVAADPSIWWSGRAILDEQESFLRSPNAGKGRRLLIETSGKKAMRPGLDAAAAARLDKARSGPNGQNIHEKLAAAKNLQRAFRHFPTESHGSMVPFAVADALDFALLGAEPGSGEETPRSP